MQSDNEPKISCAAQSKREDQSNHHYSRRADPSFARITQVHKAEANGEKNCSRPESDAIGESVLCVAAEQELFEHPDDNEEPPPEKPPTEHVQTVKRESPERISAECCDQPDQGRDFN